MILRNYYNAIAASCVGMGTGSTIADNDLTVKSPSGSIYKCSAGAVPTLYRIGGIFTSTSLSSTVDTSYIGFGSGAVPVSYDDYFLNTIHSGLQATGFVYNPPVYDPVNKKWTGSVKMVLTNTSSSEKQIREVGIVSGARTGTGTPTTTLVLIYREVLDNPFTLAAGESVNYTQNFEFTMPAS